MQKPRINYITNLDINTFSGGWSGMNRHVFLELSKAFDVRLVEKVNPPVSFADKLISKTLRLAGFRGRFTAFSKQRLNRIGHQVEASVDKSAHLNFFHGSTPWVLVGEEVPHAAYLDCCFATYINVYHNQNEFSRSQLDWLFRKEGEFLKKA
jgi:hypothetical protein